jgi:NADH-quinone oxidoreductase subunit H
VADVVAVAVRLIGGKSWSAPSAFGLGFLAAGVGIAAAVGLACFIAFDWVQGIFWFMAKTYVFVFTFVWMRGTLPRVRVDQLMGFAWKWLLPASLLNLFVTATAVVLLNQ